ncbi:uncharacterized protein DUF4157 [Saccharothrix carnea]|uniref:Uncharacterized protein DUF4157 n=1 Tax=Saccharothrix carnea TaxID=1280637 RepID=A0A2P8IBP6_SACCR|nr:DUF4157 domain-containing protein [Saccharothrix carnea]PSL55889.1 uncharacterized protein DUF4157 [Saccharothrix carnea]
MRQHDHEHHSTPPPEPLRATADRAPAGPLSPDGIRALQRAAGNTAVVGLLAGQDRDATVQRSPVHDVLRDGGKPLDEPVRREMETRLGSDFSDVRVHTGAAAHTAAESVRAHAFTSGSHIVFQRGRYDTSSEAGKRMLAHELTHVDQQRSGPVAGTDVGGGVAVSHPADTFERAAVANADRVMAQSAQRDQAPPATGARPPVADPDRTAVQRAVGFEIEVPVSTYALAPSPSTQELDEKKEIATPVTSREWVPRRPENPGLKKLRPSLIRRLAKKEVLVEAAGFTLEADDGSSGESNLEFVTEPFPEGAAGRDRLVSALDAIVRVASSTDDRFHTAAELATAAGGRELKPATPTLYFSSQYLTKGTASSGNPQMTAGIPLELLEGLFAAVSNAYDDRAHSDRTRVEAAPDLAAQDSIGAIRKAKANVDRVLGQGVAPAQEGEGSTAAPASDKLRGLLMPVAAYLIQGNAKPHEGYYKGVAPIMARTDFAAMFALLSADEQERLAAEDGEPFVRLALRCAELTAADEPVLETVDRREVSFAEVTRRKWLSGITQGRDILSEPGYRAAFPATADKGEHFESMGSLGDRMDDSRGRRAPIVELRRMRKHLPRDDWKPVLLGIFDLMTEIVENDNTDPTYRRAAVPAPPTQATTT